MAAVSVEAFPDFAPSPRAGVTVFGLDIGESIVSVWRTADGERSSVRGARRVVMNDAGYIVDYDVPLGRPVTYEVEVISGPAGANRVTSSPVTVDAAEGCIMDPLVPQNSVAIVRRRLPGGQITFAASAMAALDYEADVQLYRVLGTDKPMALFGQRMAASGVDLSLVVDAAEQNTQLRKLLKSTAQLLVRVPASWTDALPGTCFASMATVSEAPVEAAQGGVLSVWSLSADVVAAPTIKVLTATFTYGDVDILMSSYGQKQDLMAGRPYLDDLKNPLG